MGHPGLLFFKFNLHSHAHLLPSFVNCYRNVFAAAPWSEWKKCPVCKLEWGIEQKEKVEEMGYQHCGVPMEDRWPENVVKIDIEEAVIDKETSCWLAANRAGVVGFVWGYPISPAKLSDKLEVGGLPEAIKQHFGDVPRVAYMAEMGVLPEFRGHELKVAKQLAAHRLSDFRQSGLNVGVVRTKTNPPSRTYIHYRDNGYQVIHEYGDHGGRVIQARTFLDFDICTG